MSEKRARGRNPAVLREEAPKVFKRRLDSAGHSPMATPQTIESSAATANTLRSSEACSIFGMLVGAMRRKILSRAQEKNTPKSPAQIASRRLSANASRASLD